MTSRWEVSADGRVQAWVREPGAGAPVLRTGGPLPSWADAQRRLPQLVWDGHPEVEAAAALAWRLAWEHLRPPEPTGPFAAPFLDAAFNGSVFLWDAAFAQRFLVYARRVVEVGTLDGCYATQAEDGWICRTLAPDGTAGWERHDPSSTGPNVLAWTELQLAERTGDLARLAHVLPALLAYHRWTRRYRTWPDGSYWSTGWGSGMDGLPRLPDGADPNFEHGRVTWVDATLQALVSARALLGAVRLLACSAPVDDLEAESQLLAELVRDRLWDDDLGAYVDLLPDGSSAGVLHVGTFWALLAGEPDEQRRRRLVDHLTDPASFGRPFPVPALAAFHPSYQDDGGYWLGGVWTPTTLMVLDGLTAAGEGDLAHDLGRRHVELVARTASETGTLWENWSPERPVPGYGARPDFVGWSGASPLTITLEHVFGLRTTSDRVTWQVRLTERHGALRLPVGQTATADLEVLARHSTDEEPRLLGRSDGPISVELSWPDGTKSVDLLPGDDCVEF